MSFTSTFPVLLHFRVSFPARCNAFTVFIRLIFLFFIPENSNTIDAESVTRDVKRTPSIYVCYRSI